MKRIYKMSLTLAILFSSIEFVRSNVLFYTTENFDLDLAGRIGTSGSILLLAFTLLVQANLKKETN